MSYIASKYISVDVPFFDFPLGLNLQQRWNDQEQNMEFYVHRVLRASESTNYVKQGYILKKINSNSIEQPTLDELNQFLVSYKPHVSPKKPIVLTFKVFDEMGEGTPLFDPFHEKNKSDSCLDQNVEKYERTNTKLKMTSFPQPGSCSLSTGLGTTANGTHGTGGIQGNLQWLNANDVINANDLEKHMINCDSDFRTKATDSTTNFTINVYPRIKNVIRIRLASLEIPNTGYAFSSQKNNTQLQFISSGTSNTYQIESGNYSSTGLISQISTVFTATPGYTISLDPISQKTTIAASGNFTMDFRTVLNSVELNPGLKQTNSYNFPEYGQDVLYNWGLAYNLGFRQKYYQGSNSYTSEAIINTAGDQYYFLQVNDYYSITQPFPDGTTLEAFTKLVLRNNKNTEIFNDSSDFLTREYVFKQPTDISRLDIRIVDKNNNPVNLQDLGISLSLEITEVMNCKLYDFYRNYIVQKQLKY